MSPLPSGVRRASFWYSFVLRLIVFRSAGADRRIKPKIDFTTENTRACEVIAERLLNRRFGVAALSARQLSGTIPRSAARLGLRLAIAFRGHAARPPERRLPACKPKSSSPGSSCIPCRKIGRCSKPQALSILLPLGSIIHNVQYRLHKAHPVGRLGR